MEVDEIKSVRIGKLKNLLARGISPYGGRFLRSHSIAETLADFKEEKEVTLAGRIMANRKHGKAAFLDLKDQTGKIQLYIKEDHLSADQCAIVEELDIGDIIGVKGKLFKTRTGQDSVRVVEVVVLAKSLMALPEKWHGLKDVEIRYRQRYWPTRTTTGRCPARRPSA
jgi:lysyl-tRNA synthetase class 2